MTVTTYRLRATGQHGLSYEQLKKLYLEANGPMSFPASPTEPVLDLLGADPVLFAPPDHSQAIPGLTSFVPAAPVFVESRGIWQAAWTLRDARVGRDEEELQTAVAALLEAKFAAIAERRWQREISGVEINGMQIATSDRSKTLLNGKYNKALRDSNVIHRWKGGDGEEVQLTSAAIISIGDTVGEYVQACFDWELDLRAELNAVVANSSAFDALQLVAEFVIPEADIQNAFITATQNWT